MSDPSSVDIVSDKGVSPQVAPIPTIRTISNISNISNIPNIPAYSRKAPFVSQPSKEEIDELCVNLVILGTTPINTKLDTTGIFLNHEASAYYIPISMKRWWMGDSRDETIRKVERIVNKTILFCDVVNRDATRYQLNDLLTKSISGLNNIRETYSSCVQTSARIDTIISKIEEQCKHNTTDSHTNII
jgi:hypothetical protein